MSPFKSTLFVFSLLGMLALACWLMPADGVQIGEMTIQLPTLTDVLTIQQPKCDTIADQEAEVVPSVEDLLAMKRQMRLEEELLSFRQFADSSSLRICLPEGDSAYLDPVFSALDSAQYRHMRVLHYGDSQIEGDRISATLREYLQSRFGGGGLGMSPLFLPMGRITSVVTTEPELTYYRGYGPSSWKGEHRRYGPMYMVCEVHDSATTVVRALRREKYPHVQSFSRVTVMARPVANGSGCNAITMKAGSGNSSLDITPDSLGYRSITLPNGISKVELRMTGDWEMYGLLMDDTLGVSLDNVPMRSNDGSTFSSVDKSTIQPYFQQENVQLILLQFGTNAVPWLNDSTHISNWGNLLGRQIDWLHRQCPQARMLLIGPPDMSTMVKGEMQSYPRLPRIIDELRQTAQRQHIAFWSVYDAMGGWNSMLNWVNAHPALAGDDYVHFTELGAERMAGLLTDVLGIYYKNYRLRNYPNEIYETETPADSLVAGVDSLGIHTPGPGLDSIR